MGASPRHARPVPDETERERRLIVFANADRVVQLRDPGLETRGRSASSGCRVADQRRACGSCHAAAPPTAPAARRARRGARKRRDPARDTPLRQRCSAAVKLRASSARACGRERRLRKQPQQPHQQPMPVHVGVPIEAAIERRRERMRRLRIGGAVHHIRDMVGILLMQALERQRRERADAAIQAPAAAPAARRRRVRRRGERDQAGEGRGVRCGVSCGTCYAGWRERAAAGRADPGLCCAPRPVRGATPGTVASRAR